MAPGRGRSPPSSPSTSSAGARSSGPCTIGSRRGTMPPGAMPIPKRSPPCRKGLALLATLPESPERTQHELTLQLILGELLMAAKGTAAPEVGEVYTRAHTLCHQVGEPPQRFQVLRGLIAFHVAQAQLRTAGELGQQLFDLAHRQRERGPRAEGHMAVGAVAFFRGDLVAARAHLEHGLRLGDTPQPSPRSSAVGMLTEGHHLAWLMQVLWALGYADQAQQRSQEALALAQQIGHPPSLAYAELFAALLSQYRRDVAATQARADAVMAFATAQGLGHRVEQGRILRGWALAMQGDAAAGVAHIQQGLAALQDMGLKLHAPLFSRLAGGGVWPGGAARGRADGAGRGLDAGGHDRGALVGGRVVSAPGEPCCSNSRAQISPRRKPVCIRRWTWPAASRPRRWSCAPR